MGLDMYLEARRSAYKPFGEDVPEERKVLVEAADKLGLPASENIDFITISREVGYWRKANQIHKWFVDNVQNGEDDCGHHYVSREDLQKLRDVTQRVLDSCKLVKGKVNNGYTYGENGKEPIVENGETVADATLAKELLPNASGFFFGSTDYDQWYVADLKRTLAIIDKCLALPEGTEFYYHSSW